MLDNVASPAVRQKRSKLAPTSCQASSMFAAGTTAVNVVGFFMALLSFRGFDTPSLPAQGEQRLPLIFNIQRGNARPSGKVPYRRERSRHWEFARTQTAAPRPHDDSYRGVLV